jgi:hypothetical protein
MSTIDDIVRALSFYYRRSNKGSGHPVGCTPAEVDDLLSRSAATLGVTPCGQYVELLRRIDGIVYDGNKIYAHRTHPLYGPGAVTSRAVGSPVINGLVELNQFWRDRCIVPRDVLVYGGDEVYLFVGSGEDRFWYTPNIGEPGTELVSHVSREFATFNEMLLDAFRHLLDRARDRGDIGR